MRPFSIAIFFVIASVSAQVYSPKVLMKAQPDTTNLVSLARGIFADSGAQTPREKAEAIWRFFLTDGRFVKPGMIYHIAGWAYEEPQGEVLDPVKLLNSYGFGLCYHIAPLLASVFKAGGFADARVWFLTGHTVAEVFYDGSYHYFDSDMMGYSAVGTTGPLKLRPVASVRQIERDGSIITGKLVGPKQADIANVDSPWYPADVRAHAIGDLAELFTSTKDNWVYPQQRFSSGHTMDFVLRPGERLVRYFHPEPEGLFYLPYSFDGLNWREFPREIAEYKIRTADGPRSQKDARAWATGIQEYRPTVSNAASMVYRMPCPYVIIDAKFELKLALQDARQSVSVETSVDDGRTWTSAGTAQGPHQGSWTAQPAILTTSEHGSRNAVSGTYGYLVRVSQSGGAMRDVKLTTRFQVNPRTLPNLQPGRNEMKFESSDSERWELIPGSPKIQGAAIVVAGGQSYLANRDDEVGEAIYEVNSPEGGSITGFDAGARFLDLREGLAPDKFTAEVRKVAPWPAAGKPQRASIAWAERLEGPYQTLWEYDPQVKWKDGDAIDRTLRWPEVDCPARRLPPATRHVYVRYRMQGLAMDSVRLAAVQEGIRSRSALQITHVWKENGTLRERTQQVSVGAKARDYRIDISPGAAVVNESLIFEAAGAH